ncbi:MAG: hypothetical protein M0C28_12205 [Candidatus Moduliflexus flocculans]|nr:hypothetical protein [Candidatus Moduliflexus flocculans]
MKRTIGILIAAAGILLAAALPARAQPRLDTRPVAFYRPRPRQPGRLPQMDPDRYRARAAHRPALLRRSRGLDLDPAVPRGAVQFVPGSYGQPPVRTLLLRRGSRPARSPTGPRAPAAGSSRVPGRSATAGPTRPTLSAF